MPTSNNLIELIPMIDFAKRLKQLREERSMTQARLASLLDIDPRAYNRWERGSNMPQLDTLIKIADILKVSLDELVGRTESISEPKIRNNKLLHLYEKVDNLPDQDQQALVIMLDGLVARSNMQKLVGESQTIRN